MHLNHGLLAQSLAMMASAGLLAVLSMWLFAAKHCLPSGRPGQFGMAFMESFSVSSPCLSPVQGCTDADMTGWLK